MMKYIDPTRLYLALGGRFNYLPLSAEKVYLATHEGEELTCKA